MGNFNDLFVKKGNFGKRLLKVPVFNSPEKQVKSRKPHVRLKAKNDFHGMSKSRLYSIWKNMVHRCLDPNFKGYSRYGGRGISVCEKWLSFDAFYTDMKDGYKDHLTLDRINNDGNYEKNNCRWATDELQNNNRSNTRFLTIHGQTALMKKWATISGTKYITIFARFRAGYSHEECVYGRKPEKYN